MLFITGTVPIKRNNNILTRLHGIGPHYAKNNNKRIAEYCGVSLGGKWLKIYKVALIYKIIKQ